MLEKSIAKKASFSHLLIYIHLGAKEDMQGEDGEDNDPDYKESEDQERVASKTYDSEEYRDDRAVRVSRTSV